MPKHSARELKTVYTAYLSSLVFLTLAAIAFVVRVNPPSLCSKFDYGCPGSGTPIYTPGLPPMMLDMSFTNGVVQDATGLNALVYPSDTALSNSQYYNSSLGFVYSAPQTNGQYISWNVDQPSCSNYSLTVWMKITCMDSGTAIRFVNSSGFNGPIVVEFHRCGFFVHGTLMSAITYNQWFHLAVVYLNDQLVWYVNGDYVYTSGAWSIPSTMNGMQGTLQFYTGAQIAHTCYDLGSVHLYCGTLNDSAMVQQDMIMTGTPVEIPPTYPLGDTSGMSTEINNTPLDQVLSNEYLRAEFCSNTQPSDVENQPLVVPSYYHSYFVDQVNGVIGNAGTSPAAPYPSPESVRFLGGFTSSYSFVAQPNLGTFGKPYFYDDLNIAYQGIWTTCTGSTPCSLSPKPTIANPPVVNPVGLWNGCPALEFTTSTTGVMVFSQEVSLGVWQSFPAISNTYEFSFFFWINMQSLNATIYVGGDYFVQNYSPVSSTAWKYTIYSLSVQLALNQWYFIHFTTSYLLSVQSLYVNGALVSTLPSYVPYQPANRCSHCSFWETQGNFVASLGLFTTYMFHFLAESITSTYQWASTTSSCSLYNQCTSVQFCQGDRYFQSRPVNVQTSGNASCPIFVGSYDCNRGNTYPLISGGLLLPQTSEIGWQQLSNWQFPGGKIGEVFAYNLTQLWQLGFFPNDPRNADIYNWAPLVMNTLYQNPRTPNMLNPDYPWGRTLQESLLTFSTQAADFSALANYYIMPGGWCKAFYYDMFNQNQTLYDEFFLTNNASGLAGMWSNTMEQTYLAVTVPIQGFNSSNYLNCSLWYETEVSYASPRAHNFSWTDTRLLTIGIWPEHAGTFNESSDTFTGTTFGYAYPSYLWNNPYDDYNIEIIQYSGINSNAAVFAQDTPAAANPGGTTTYNTGMWLMGFNAAFDAPGESLYDPVGGVLYMVPWDATHAATLLEVSDAPMNAVNWAQNQYNWAQAYNQIGYKFTGMQIATQFTGFSTYPTEVVPQGQMGFWYGLTVGWTNLTVANSPVYVQEIELAHWTYQSGYPSFGALCVSSQSSILVNNVSIHHAASGGITLNCPINDPIAACLVVNVTIANLTWVNQALNSGISNEGSTVDESTLGPVYFINNDWFLFSGANANVNMMRGGRLLQAFSQDLFNGAPEIIEHMTMNHTQFQCGDCELFGYSGNPPYFNFHYNDWDGMEEFSSNLMDAGGLYTFSTHKGEVPRTFYWSNWRQTLHANRWLNWYGGSLSGLNYWGGYYSDQVIEISTQFMQDGQIEGSYGTDNSASWDPTNFDAAMGRPYGYFNNFFISRSSIYSQSAFGTESPVTYPSVISNTLHMLLNPLIVNPDLSVFYVNQTACYANLYNASGTIVPVNDSYSYALPANWYTVLIAAYEADVLWASQRNVNQPIVDPVYCPAAATSFEQQVLNEKALHWTATQPFIEAQVRTSMPFYIPLTAVPSTQAQLYQPQLDRVTPTVNPLINASLTNQICTNRLSCAPYLVLDLAPSVLTGQWMDPSGVQVVVSAVLGGTAGAFYLAGSSYDAQVGLVVDTRNSVGIAYELSNVPTSYNRYTLSVWVAQAWGNNAKSWIGNFETIYGNTDHYYPMESSAFAAQNGNVMVYTSGSGQTKCASTTSSAISLAETFAWQHYTMVYDAMYMTFAFYQNGSLVANCNGIPFPVFQSGVGFLQYLPTMIYDYKIYAFTANSTVVRQLYLDSLASFDPPITFPILDSSSGMFIDATWQAGSGVFTISPSSSIGIVTLNALNASYGFNQVGIDPIFETGDTVFLQGSQFSFPCQQGLANWQLSVQVAWASLPGTSAFWWRMPSTTTNDVLVFYINSNNQFCFNVNLGFASSTTYTSQQTLCYASTMTIQINTMYRFDWLVSSSTQSIDLYINEAYYGSVTPAVFVATTGVVAFQVPKPALQLVTNYASPITYDVWMYSTSTYQT